MDIPTKKPAELSMTEFIALVRETVQDILTEEGTPPHPNQRGLLELEPLSLGAWTGAVSLIKREDYYDDTER